MNKLSFMRKPLRRVVQFVHIDNTLSYLLLRIKNDTNSKLSFYIHIIVLCTQMKPVAVIQIKK